MRQLLNIHDYNKGLLWMQMPTLIQFQLQQFPLSVLPRSPAVHQGANKRLSTTKCTNLGLVAGTPEPEGTQPWAAMQI